jgi:hypothetical protein
MMLYEYVAPYLTTPSNSLLRKVTTSALANQPFPSSQNSVGLDVQIAFGFEQFIQIPTGKAIKLAFKGWPA